MKTKNLKKTNVLEEGDDCLFENGDLVGVLSNKDDLFNDFAGTVIGYKGKGIVQVRDQDDDVWDVGENQCELVDRTDNRERT